VRVHVCVCMCEGVKDVNPLFGCVACIKYMISIMYKIPLTLNRVTLYPKVNEMVKVYLEYHNGK